MYMWENYPQYRRLCFHPNNEANIGAIAAGIAKAKGVVPGVADYIMLIGNDKGDSGLVIEFKLPGETQSDKQTDFMHKVRQQRFVYAIAYSLQDAIEAWDKYRN